MNTAEALATVYEVFSSEQRPRSLPVCACCVSEEDVKRLLSVPLKKLSPDDLSSYASSVFLTSGSEADFRYYLPRILDISIHDSRWWPSREVVLRSLQLANWLEWSPAEQESLHCLFRIAFNQAVYERSDVDDIDSWICGLSRAGMNLAPYLETLEDPAAIQALVGYYERNSESLQKRKLGNAFWEGETTAEAIVAWFESEQVKAAIWKHYGL